jgi:hypothetical protein
MKQKISTRRISVVVLDACPLKHALPQHEFTEHGTKQMPHAATITLFKIQPNALQKRGRFLPVYLLQTSQFPRIA